MNFQTCFKLFSAGFPQPEFKEGQYWYDILEQVFFENLFNKKLIVYNSDGNLRMLEAGEFICIDGDERLVYCPTELELLAQLPEVSLSAYEDAEAWQITYDVGTSTKAFGITKEELWDTLANLWLNETSLRKDNGNS